jgi:transcriptional regulator with XRE-family HTH domain
MRYYIFKKAQSYDTFSFKCIMYKPVSKLLGDCKKMEIKVGEIIKQKREEKNYNLIDFASIIGISAGYLSQLENGRKANPKLEIILKIIRELDIDIDMLLGIEANNSDGLGNKIPSLLKLVIAKERNARVLEDKEILRKICSHLENVFESKYVLEDKNLYNLYLEDISGQAETTLKRYMGLQVLLSIKV